jgi:Cu/Ag efflux protein CusF
MKSMVVVATVLLSGCAAYELPPLSPNHPANPVALSAPQRQISKTLKYTRADVPSPRPVVDAAAASQDGHEGHHAGDSTQKTVTGEGKVVATVPSTAQLVIDHAEIKGFMGAMTMGYPVEPPSLLEGLKSGDQVRFTIDVPKKAIIKVEKKQ